MTNVAERSVPSKAARLGAFLDRLRAAPAAASRDQALALMKTTMDGVESELVGDDAPYSAKMHVFGWECEWKDLASDPCYWDDSWSKVHRTQIYNNGRIVITKLRAPISVVLDKPGL